MTALRAIVCGSRFEEDRAYVFHVLDGLAATMGLAHVIEGGQRRRDRFRHIVGGVDYLAMCWAKERGLTWETVEADWVQHGRAAGPMRNAEMLARRPGAVIAFPGGNGTEDMIRQARRAGVGVVAIRPKAEIMG